MKRILFFLHFCVFSNFFFAQENVRFAWLTDTHVGGATGAADLSNSVRDINFLDKIEFVIISGDITQTGKDSDLILAKSILDSLIVPYYIIPGNHDTKWSESGATKFARLWSSDKFVFRKNGYMFIGLHQGPLMKMGDGHFAPEDLRWLDSVLAGTDKNTPIILVSHYPLDSSIDNWFEVTKRISSYNTQFVLVGHGHTNKKMNFDGITGVMGRSNLRNKESRGGYNIVNIEKDSAYFFVKSPGSEARFWNSEKMGNKVIDKPAFVHPDFSINKIDSPKIEIKWKHNTGYTITSTPAVRDNYVITGNTSGKVICLDLSDGSEKWNYQTGAPVYSNPLIYSDKIYFGSADSNIYCLDLDGKLKWKFRTGAAVISSPSVKNNVIYIGSSDHVFRAIDAGTGNLIWENKDIGGFVETKPLIYGNKVIFGAWDTYLYALNIYDGSLAWKWSNGNKEELFSPAVCVPVAAKNKLFIVAPDRYMSCINVSNGNTTWRSNKFLVREAVGITGDSTIIVRCITDSLVAFDPEPDYSSVKWISDLKYGYDINPFMPVEKNGSVFTGTKNGVLYAADAAKGSLLWSYKLTHVLINTVFAVSDKDIVATTMDGEVIRIMVQ